MSIGQASLRLDLHWPICFEYLFFSLNLAKKWFNSIFHFFQIHNIHSKNIDFFNPEYSLKKYSFFLNRAVSARACNQTCTTGCELPIIFLRKKWGKYMFCGGKKTEKEKEKTIMDKEKLAQEVCMDENRGLYKRSLWT